MVTLKEQLELLEAERQLRAIDREWPELSAAPDDIKGDRAVLEARVGYLRAKQAGRAPSDALRRAACLSR